MKELQRQANSNIVIAFVGNKIDLVQDDAPVSEEDEEDDEEDDATATGADDDADNQEEHSCQQATSQHRGGPSVCHRGWSALCGDIGEDWRGRCRDLYRDR